MYTAGMVYDDVTLVEVVKILSSERHMSFMSILSRPKELIFISKPVIYTTDSQVMQTINTCCMNMYIREVNNCFNHKV